MGQSVEPLARIAPMLQRSTANISSVSLVSTIQLAGRSASLRPAACKAPALRSAGFSLRMQEDTVAEAAEVSI